MVIAARHAQGSSFKLIVVLILFLLALAVALLIGLRASGLMEDASGRVTGLLSRSYGAG